MRFRNALFVCASLVAGDAWACGMTGTVVPFTVAAEVGQQAAAGDLPAPSATVTEIVRGIGANHASCDDTGLLTVVVEWPRGRYKLREVGFEFSVAAATGPAAPGAAIFPQGPVQGRINGRNGEFLFLWRDGAPAQQAFIDLQVDVRAVTAQGQRGPPTRLLVRAAPGS